MIFTVLILISICEAAVFFYLVREALSIRRIRSKTKLSYLEATECFKRANSYYLESQKMYEEASQLDRNPPTKKEYKTLGYN